MMDKQAFIEGYAAARKSYLQREKERKIALSLDYKAYRGMIAEKQRKATFRVNKPKGTRV